MKEIIGFIRRYWQQVNKGLLIACTFFTAILIWFNYGYGLESWLVYKSGLPWPDFTGHVLLFLLAFTLPHLLFWKKRHEPITPAFLICLLLAPAFFAFKMAMPSELIISTDAHWNYYWNEIIYWPVRMLALTGFLFICWRIFHPQENFYGLSAKQYKIRPYIWMLVIMLPLIAAASTQPDFLATYPKFQQVLPLPDAANPGWLYKLLFELSYGTDFFSIEIFFRGFLIIGFIKWAGKDAIIPMACFYCTIHFGKPLGECISSYFGGLLLGIVSYHTRSIWGGLIVHLGIAWLMELGGYLGHVIKW